ncbi:MAG: DUF4838 domain-containing protein, partial [Planctomycetota bacterium]
MKNQLTAAFVILTSLITFSSPLLSGDTLSICENGKSAYQIVLPDQKSDEDNYLFFYLKEGAETLKRCIKDATGALIPVVSESTATKDKPGIYLGATSKALSLGIKPEQMRDFQYKMKASGKDIILVGLDQRGKRNIKNFAFHRLGTVKAITSFLEKFLGVKFVLPGSDGVAVPKSDKILIPVNLNESNKPKLDFCMSRNKEMIFDIANNLYPSHTYAHHGGHSHSKAIPAEKFGKSNPEYFFLHVNKKRFGNKRKIRTIRPQFCLSNPKVQELIYQELLTHIDDNPNYEVVQLAQSDGFLGCACKNCVELYGIKPKASPEAARDFYADPAWGWKLWTMHKQMAERFLKDRPGKLITLSYYGPTKNVPDSF